MATITDVRNIERTPLAHVDDVEAQLRGDVLTRANKLFGYKADSFGAAGPLAKKLVELDIAPLRTDQVQEYMASKARTREISYNKRVMLGWLCVASLYWGFIVGHYHFSAPLLPLLIGVLATMLSLVFCGSIAADNGFGKYKETWLWIESILYAEHSRSYNYSKNHSNYPRYVPVHVLHDVVRLVEALPSVDITVHELTYLREELRNPLPDPFLKATLGTESYYIAVWDEREYEAKM